MSPTPSKNNPDARLKNNEIIRNCNSCGKSGIIGKDIERVQSCKNHKSTFIWKCKQKCK